MSIWTRPRSRARRTMLSSRGPAKIPGKSVKRSNRRSGASPDSDTNRVFVWQPRAKDVQDFWCRGHQGGQDEIGTDRGVIGLGLVTLQPDRSHAGAVGARDVEAE